jgi:hypothetical protein
LGLNRAKQVLGFSQVCSALRGISREELLLPLIVLVLLVVLEWHNWV